MEDAILKTGGYESANREDSMRRLLALLIVTACTVLVSGCVMVPGHVHWDVPYPWFPGYYILPGLLGLALYFLPTIIVLARRKKKVLGPILVNVLAGWTIIGWIIALIWSLTVDE